MKCSGKERFRKGDKRKEKEGLMRDEQGVRPGRE
jgi:hypothetical protein